MRFTKGFLTEAEKAEKANEGRPAWMTDDELWNKLTPERKKEVVDREAKVQQEMETVKNQVEQKAKFTPGSAPTSDNLQDFFNTVDRQGAQARATGEDIGLVANREAGRAIEAQRAEEKKAANLKSEKEAQERVSATEDFGKKAGIQRTANIGGKDLDVFTSRVNAARSELSSKGIDPDKASPEQLKAAADAWDRQRTARQKQETETAVAQTERMEARGATGRVVSHQGEEINIDKLVRQGKEGFSDTEEGKKARLDWERQTRRATEALGREESEYREQESEKIKEKNRETRLKNMEVTALQAEVQKDPSSAVKHKALQDYLGAKRAGEEPSIQQPTQPQATPQPAVAPVKTAPIPPQPATQSAASAVGTPVPANVQRKTSAPAPQPAAPQSSSTPVPTPKQPEQSGVFGGPKKENAAVSSVSDRGTAYAAASAPSSRRLTGKKATAGIGTRGQVSQVGMAESLRFTRGELKHLLETTETEFFNTIGRNIRYPSNLINTAKSLKTLAGVPKIISMLKTLGPGLKAPQDRTVYIPQQAGYSKAKGARTVQQLMKNPALLHTLSTVTGNISPGSIMNLLGQGARGLAIAARKAGGFSKGVAKGVNTIGKSLEGLGAEYETPEAQAQKAIFAGGILGDPRTWLLTPQDVAQKSKEDKEDKD